MKETKYIDSGILLIDKDNVIIKFGDENIIFYNNFFEEEFKINVDASTNHIVKTYDKKFIVFDLNKSVIYNEKGIKVGEDSNYYLPYNFNGEVFISENNDQIIFRKKNELLSFPYIYGEKVFIEGYYIQVYSDKNYLKNYSLNSGLELWKREFREFLDTPTTECQRELITYKNQLFFIVYSEGVTKCICLDIPTGNIIKEYSGLRGQMIIEGEILYFLSPDNISIINTETQEVTRCTITDIFDATEIKRLLFPRWAVQDRIIYFTQSGSVDMHSGSRGAIFGAFDVENSKILWYHQLPKENGIIGSIEVQDDRIYLHTQDKTLFVYEKE